MTATAILLVAVGGGVGAGPRHLVERWAVTHHRGTLPLGLFLVNVVGSAIAGVVLGGTTGALQLFLPVGVCGALTTYSGFGAAVHRLWSSDRHASWITIVGMPTICIAVAALGYAVVGTI
jgi:CrcB protein